MKQNLEGLSIGGKNDDLRNAAIQSFGCYKGSQSGIHNPYDSKSSHLHWPPFLVACTAMPSLPSPKSSPRV